MPTPSNTFCRIRIAGTLDRIWENWFEQMTLEPDPAHTNETLIQGVVADRAALHGLLGKIRDLNLTLLAMECTPTNGARETDSFPT